MSRRRSLRVELDGLLPEAPSLEFESGLVVQISDVSPEINETAMPSAEAPGKAAQSALTAGPLAHEQATIPCGSGRLAVARLRSRWRFGRPDSARIAL